jgi:hypothetical protein
VAAGDGDGDGDGEGEGEGAAEAAAAPLATIHNAKVESRRSRREDVRDMVEP